jgi:hypothetical protein
MSMRRLKFSVAGLVLLHLVVVSLHGIAHQRLGIDLQTWQRAFVASVIFAGPLVALAVLWTSPQELGAVLLAVSMAGSSVFGICNHFFLSSSDNVFFLRQSGWAHWFTATAVLLAIIETACFVWCVWTLSFERGNKQNIRKLRRDA